MCQLALPIEPFKSQKVFLTTLLAPACSPWLAVPSVQLLFMVSVATLDIKLILLLSVMHLFCCSWGRT
jgi:hypothetical protein